jgi:hypothetical protein
VSFSGVGNSAVMEVSGTVQTLEEALPCQHISRIIVNEFLLLINVTAVWKRTDYVAGMVMQVCEGWSCGKYLIFIFCVAADLFHSSYNYIPKIRSRIQVTVCSYYMSVANHAGSVTKLNKNEI